ESPAPEDAHRHRCRGAVQRTGHFILKPGNAERGRADLTVADPVYPRAVQSMGGAGRLAADSLAALAHGAAELGGSELRAAGDLNCLCPGGSGGPVRASRACLPDEMGWDYADHDRCHAGEPHGAAHDAALSTRYDRAAAFRGAVMKWALVTIIVLATTAGEVLQAIGMRQHGEIHDFRPGALGRVASALAQSRYILAAMVAMAVSFFAFMALVSIAELSFAVPVTAASYVLEAIFAKY